MTRPEPDRLLLRRARRRLAVQNTVAMMLILLVVGAVALLVVTHEQRSALGRSLRQTAATEEDVVDPPGGTWIFRLDSTGKTKATEDAPEGFPDRAALKRVAAGGPTETSSRTVAGNGYLMVTARRKSSTVQVVGALAAADEERRRLLMALGLAELLGLLASAGAAALLARRATAPLGEALARQRRFVADASHELRTPLTQLHTRAQLLRQDVRAGATSEEMTPDVEQLVAGTRQLGEVVEDLLLATTLPTRADATEVDLGVVAAGVVTELLPRARDRGVELSLVPATEGPPIVRGRQSGLRRVVTALIDNALSHTPQGGHVTVELTREHSPRQVVLIVRDDGSGFDPADRERIFGRFARGHGDHRRFGLGLALAREVVTGHGGSIEAWGEPDHGATFTVRLPT